MGHADGLTAQAGGLAQAVGRDARATPCGRSGGCQVGFAVSSIISVLRGATTCQVPCPALLGGEEFVVAAAGHGTWSAGRRGWRTLQGFVAPSAADGDSGRRRMAEVATTLGSDCGQAGRFRKWNGTGGSNGGINMDGRYGMEWRKEGQGHQDTNTGLDEWNGMAGSQQKSQSAARQWPLTGPGRAVFFDNRREARRLSLHAVRRSLRVVVPGVRRRPSKAVLLLPSAQPAGSGRCPRRLSACHRVRRRPSGQHHHPNTEIVSPIGCRAPAPPASPGSEKPGVLLLPVCHWRRPTAFRRTTPLADAARRGPQRAQIRCPAA